MAVGSSRRLWWARSGRALSHPYAGAEAGARLASRACGLRVPLLAASGGGLVAIVVTHRVLVLERFGEEEGRAWCPGVVEHAWSEEEVFILTRRALRVPAALAGEGLVIPTRPCSRGSPLNFLQLGARHRGCSVSDGLRRRLWRRVVVSSSESERCELL
ncbi:hypothetical protein Taro_023830 [Colocasia esculenta]|uniref:Uncharacterized protein n=1 Tax=Colocasia esculenta TaxID=4460 RepID=A0A843VCM3_COLES|nr:hypothetical protein [Colocasia esculenta]